MPRAQGRLSQVGDNTTVVGREPWRGACTAHACACHDVKEDASNVHKGEGFSLLAREFSHAWLIGEVT